MNFLCLNFVNFIRVAIFVLLYNEAALGLLYNDKKIKKFRNKETKKFRNKEIKKLRN